MKRDPVIKLIALLALIQVLAIVCTVVPFSPEKSTFYAAPPDMIEIQESRGGKIEPLKKADTTIYVRGDLLHEKQVNWAGANIIILGLAALYRWRKLKKAEPGGAANGSQPLRSETNRTSSAAGSGR